MKANPSDYLTIDPSGRGRIELSDRALVAKMAELRTLIGDYRFKAEMNSALRVAVNNSLREHSPKLLAKAARREARQVPLAVPPSNVVEFGPLGFRGSRQGRCLQLEIEHD